MKFKKGKPEKGAGSNDEKDKTSRLDHLKQTIARLNQATTYGTPEKEPEYSGGYAADYSAGLSEMLPEPTPADDDEYNDALSELTSLNAGTGDRPLRDMLDRYLGAVKRKHHAWMWQQNFPDASLHDKDKMWFDLQQADEDTTALTQELNSRIEELLGD